MVTLSRMLVNRIKEQHIMKFPCTARALAGVLVLFVLLGLQGCSGWVSPALTPPPASYQMAPGADTSWVLETPDNDHLLLFGQWWLPPADKPMRAIVLLVHGTLVHSGFYYPMAEDYANNGIAVFGIDLRGWGQSQGYGRRGNITTYDDYLTDVRTAADEIRKEYPGVPMFIQGESMGGTIALLAGIHHIDTDGLILNAPAVEPGLFIGPLRTPRFLARGGLATLSLPGKIAPNMPMLAPMHTLERVGAGLFLKEKQNRERFLNDPFSVHHSLPWSYLSSLHDAVKEVRKGLKQIDVPVLIQQGTKDVLIPVYSSQDTYDALAVQDKTLKIYKGLTHATLHDRKRELVWQDDLDWMTHILDNGPGREGLAVQPTQP